MTIQSHAGSNSTESLRVWVTSGSRNIPVFYDSLGHLMSATVCTESDHFLHKSESHDIDVKLLYPVSTHSILFMVRRGLV